jgi:hypothetical protein
LEKIAKLQEDAITKADVEKQKKEEEDAKKEAEAKALAAPIRPGEFSISVIPDGSAQQAFAIPVHVLSGTEDTMDTWTSRVDAYWANPSGSARTVVFGSSGTGAAQTFGMPLQTGHDTVVVIAKLPKPAGAETRIMKISLKREPNPDEPLQPIRRAKSVRVGTRGVFPN